MGDTSETNTKVLSQELFLGVVALKRLAISKNHYLRNKDPFLRYGHIYRISSILAQAILFKLPFGSKVFEKLL